MYITCDNMNDTSTKTVFNIKKWAIIGSIAILPFANPVNVNASAAPKANAKIISIKTIKGPYYNGQTPGSTEVIARLNNGDEVGHVYSLKPKLYVGEKVDAVLGNTGYYNFYPLLQQHQLKPAVKCPPSIVYIYKPIIRKENIHTAPAVTPHLKSKLHKETAITKQTITENSNGHFLDKAVGVIGLISVLSAFVYKKIKEKKKKNEEKK